MKPTCNGLLCSRISGSPDLLLFITQPRSSEGREASTSCRPIRRRTELHAARLEAAGMPKRWTRGIVCRKVCNRCGGLSTVIANSRKERIFSRDRPGEVSGKELPSPHTPRNPLRQSVQAGEKKK
jgi:hypothetical protein